MAAARLLALLCALMFPLSVRAETHFPPSDANVVFSQVLPDHLGGYPPYVELFNRGTTPVSLAGWSVQYAVPSSATWIAMPLTGTIQPARAFLIRTSLMLPGENMPTPDLVGALPMVGTVGKVALARTALPFTSSCPSGDPSLNDLLGYGQAADCAERLPLTQFELPAAMTRKDSGCQDTDNNAEDFTAGIPTPRNSGVIAMPYPCNDVGVRVEGPTRYAPGAPMAYTLVVSNGPYPAAPLFVTATLAGGQFYMNSSGAYAVDANEGSVTFTLYSPTTNAPISISLVALARQNIGEVRVPAGVIPSRGDANPSNNFAVSQPATPVAMRVLLPIVLR